MSGRLVSVGLESVDLEARGPRAGFPGLPPRLREVDLTLAADRKRAVDPEELAAYLEADGLSDEALRGRYGAGGLFEAAEQLYRQPGTGADLDRRLRPPRPAFPWGRTLRGPLYLLPGLSGLLVARALGPAATAAFVYAAVFGWGWTTTLASLRYAEPLGVPGRALRAALALGTVAGVLGGALCGALQGAATGAGLGDAGLGALVGGAVALAALSAGVLLTLNRTAQYLGAFASPLVAALAVSAAPSARAALLALGLLALMPLLSALNATRSPGTLSGSWTTLRRHLPPALHGWAVALGFVLLSARLGAWTLLPLVLGTGLLEGTVWHLQERLQRLARLSMTLRQLRRGGALTLVLGAAAFAGVVAGGAYVVPRLPLAVPALAEAWPLMGLAAWALLLSAWLANQGRLAVLAALWGGGAGLLLVFPAAPLPALTLAAAALCAGLTALTLHAAHDPRSYR